MTNLVQFTVTVTVTTEQLLPAESCNAVNRAAGQLCCQQHQVYKLPVVFQTCLSEL